MSNNLIFSYNIINTHELIIMFSYESLWTTMKGNGIAQYFLLNSGIDNKTLNSLKKNKTITLLTVERLRSILDCTPNDIIVFK